MSIKKILMSDELAAFEYLEKKSRGEFVDFNYNELSDNCGVYQCEARKIIENFIYHRMIDTRKSKNASMMIKTRELKESNRKLEAASIFNSHMTMHEKILLEVFCKNAIDATDFFFVEMSRPKIAEVTNMTTYDIGMAIRMLKLRGVIEKVQRGNTITYMSKYKINV